jgi:hypothetical protein
LVQGGGGRIMCYTAQTKKEQTCISMLLVGNVATAISQMHYFAICFPCSGYCYKMAAATADSSVITKVNYCRTSLCLLGPRIPISQNSNEEFCHPDLLYCRGSYSFLERSSISLHSHIKRKFLTSTCKVWTFHLRQTNIPLLKFTRPLWSLSFIQDSIVGIATGYGLDNWGVGVQVPVGSRFSLLYIIQPGSGFRPT